MKKVHVAGVLTAVIAVLVALYLPFTEPGSACAAPGSVLSSGPTSGPTSDPTPGPASAPVSAPG